MAARPVLDAEKVQTMIKEWDGKKREELAQTLGCHLQTLMSYARDVRKIDARLCRKRYTPKSRSEIIRLGTTLYKISTKKR